MLKFFLGNQFKSIALLILCAVAAYYYLVAARYKGLYQEQSAKVTVYESRVVDFENAIQSLNHSVSKQNSAIRLLASEKAAAEEAMRQALIAIKPSNDTKSALILETEAEKLKAVSCEMAVSKVKSQLAKEINLP